MITPLAQPTILEDAPAVANIIRLFLMVVGFTLAGLLAKIAYWEWRDSRRPDHVRSTVMGKDTSDWERITFLLTTALLALTPALSTAYRFDAPLQGITTPIYVLALGMGAVTVGYRISLPMVGWLVRLVRRRRRR